MAFKERLQYLIDRKNIQQKDLAIGVGINDSRITDWLKGKVEQPRRSTITKLAGFFGCNIEWLASGDGAPFEEEHAKNLTTYETKTNNLTQTIKEEEAQQVRMYRKLAKMDADVLHEIQTWLEDMERIKPGFTGWFRLEFQNRFPEFDDWKEKITKNSRTGTGY